jgi:ubiquitin carboxyl-terminal hydrolase 5/13
MNTFLGLSKEFVEVHARKTGNMIFYHIRSVRKPEVPEQKKVDEPPEKKPTRLAIGVEGGFDGGEVKKAEFEDHTSIVILPEFQTIPLPNPNLPQKFLDCVAGIKAAHSSSKTEAVAAWDGEQRKVTRYANTLVQLPSNRSIPPSGWKCDECEMTQNLWLNLTDGTIHCGRKYFDGSGGNNHAVDYYEKTRYPLVVKLGTITPDGADVYSYAEDEMVEDPNLDRHLAHWGINIANMRKTDATMTELEIDMNMRIGEWSTIQELGEKLVPVFGPGYTGLKNLGNSCYFNSVIQVLFTIPEFASRYFDTAEKKFTSSSGLPTEDFTLQMCKMAVGILSGRYSKAPNGDNPAASKKEESAEKEPQFGEGISPHVLKSLVGRGHPEFSTSRQQDACEYFLHLLDYIDRKERVEKGPLNPTQCFLFQMEERIQCAKSGKVRYTKSEERVLRLPVPIEEASNLEAYLCWEKTKEDKQAKREKIDPKESVRAEVKSSSCLDSLFSPVKVLDFYSSEVDGLTEATKTTRMASFPDYLMVQLNKFTLAADWTPKKLDVSVDMPNELDLTPFRGSGLQPGEVEIASGEPSQKQDVPDEGLVSQLVDMGFPLDGCKRAVYHTKNQGVEPAMEWVLQHMDDPEFSVPFEIPSAKPSDTSGPVSEDGVSMLVAMGFTRDQAVKALKQTNGNLERAGDWLFSHMDELDAMETESPQGGVPKYTDGGGSK